MENQNLINNFFENIHSTKIYVTEKGRNEFNQKSSSTKNSSDNTLDCCVKCSPACDCTRCDCCIRCNMP